MQNRMLKKCLVICVICVLMIVSFPNINGELEYYNNSLVFIVGKCNSTKCGSIWWKLGLYIPVVKRNFFIMANNKEEGLINVVVLSINNGFGTYFNYKEIRVEMYRARGMFYWGGKSLLFNQNNSPLVFALCRAKTVYVTT